MDNRSLQQTMEKIPESSPNWGHRATIQSKIQVWLWAHKHREGLLQTSSVLQGSVALRDFSRNK